MLCRTVGSHDRASRPLNSQEVMCGSPEEEAFSAAKLFKVQTIQWLTWKCTVRVCSIIAAFGVLIDGWYVTTFAKPKALLTETGFPPLCVGKS